ncbi:hypothetical protein B0H17DRAFT_1128879 [Mycena rosella]|uniref:Uncharacterized protein n=1 Tax=Mycena rosella TaxID=1033263 RepID=A0AAD7DXD0_MYCRO|nr:hypothetical protein B0H17DRAFT_1128879 [Mycena rosella]
MILSQQPLNLLMNLLRLYKAWHLSTDTQWSYYPNYAKRLNPAFYFPTWPATAFNIILSSMCSIQFRSMSSEGTPLHTIFLQSPARSVMDNVLHIMQADALNQLMVKELDPHNVGTGCYVCDGYEHQISVKVAIHGSESISYLNVDATNAVLIPNCSMKPPQICTPGDKNTPPTPPTTRLCKFDAVKRAQRLEKWLGTTNLVIFINLLRADISLVDTYSALDKEDEEFRVEWVRAQVNTEVHKRAGALGFDFDLYGM